jgi:hypothetical protein
VVEKDVPLGNGVYVIDASILCKEHAKKTYEAHDSYKIQKATGMEAQSEFSKQCWCEERTSFHF